MYVCSCVGAMVRARSGVLTTTTQPCLQRLVSLYEIVLFLQRSRTASKSKLTPTVSILGGPWDDRSSPPQLIFPPTICILCSHAHIMHTHGWCISYTNAYAHAMSMPLTICRLPCYTRKSNCARFTSCAGIPAMPTPDPPL